ncbi:MAG TPA: PAS domain-containing protein [Sphingobium sp.]|uniref:PAS domain-containing protein n=1 Tax=Sphingobium sp. TaxID=1912891 RepID=UPI002ED4026C
MSEEEAARLLGLDTRSMPAWTQGLLITDGALVDNPIIFVSQGFTTLTGYASHLAMGRNARFLQGADTDRRTVMAVREAIRERRRFDGDILNYRKDGRPFWSRMAIGPLDTPGSQTLFIGLQFDVSQQHGAG